MSFDLCPWGDFLVTGSEAGCISAYSTKTFENVYNDYIPNSDCINSVSVHPYSGLLVTVSGQRHFVVNTEENSNDTLTDNSDSFSEISVYSIPKKTLEIQNSL